MKSLYFSLIILTLLPLSLFATKDDAIIVRLKELNNQANAMVEQEEFFNVSQRYLETDAASSQANRAIATLKNDPNSINFQDERSGAMYCGNLFYKTPEALGIVLKHKDLLSSLELSKQGYDRELIDSWHKSPNEEVRSIAASLQNKINIEKAHREHAPNQEVFFDKVTHLNSAVSKKELAVDNTPYLKGALQDVNGYCDHLKNEAKQGIINAQETPQDIQHIEDLKKQCDSYAQQKSSIGTTYESCIKSIKDIIAKQPKNQQSSLRRFLRIQTPYSVQQDLPDTLQQQSEPKENDFISDILKQQHIQKKPVKKPVRTQQKKQQPKGKMVQSTANTTQQSVQQTTQSTPKITPVTTSSVISIPKPISPDTDYMLREDNESITVRDVKNDALLYVFKTDTDGRQAKLPSISYTQNVKQWFENPEQAIKDQGYLDPNNAKLTDPKEHKKVILQHAFSRMIDSLLAKYGKQTKTPSRIDSEQQDTAVIIPGGIQQEKNAFKPGLFTYLINGKNQYYHRLFAGQKPGKMIQQYYQKGFFDVHFPSLKLTTSKKTDK